MGIEGLVNSYADGVGGDLPILFRCPLDFLFTDVLFSIINLLLLACVISSFNNLSVHCPVFCNIIAFKLEISPCFPPLQWGFMYNEAMGIQVAVKVFAFMVDLLKWSID
ncbi:hypothetical protein L1049_025807 [Liquidambar formosana]|uniref:Uncharacterized protein n=1 Tax=Liquidambar formosana TaxID=63359 RepID=A0AAP0NEC1_LIQFO